MARPLPFGRLISGSSTPAKPAHASPQVDAALLAAYRSCERSHELDAFLAQQLKPERLTKKAKHQREKITGGHTISRNH